MQSQLKSSLNYVWATSDVLGQGATGAVYKARHKDTGELFAVKTFNHMGQMRPMEVQMREFDVLQKLNHENIVRLLAIEEELTSGGKVLVMELCTGGSLYNMLDDPLNAFGLEENEFLQALNDVAEGMKHLREEGVVHRDIKPGNIMRYMTDDGRSFFKLTDFGAARELQEEEQFMSLYGTEEYLHPDMYERAVLRRPVSQPFGAQVDLWSLGVTFYHVGTGQLPFRPYGGRRNKETMYKITTDKASGVISGVQHSEGGPIEWSRELPKTCRLSMGARKSVTPLLAGLMECNPRRMWSFDMFFEEVRRIRDQRLMYVYNVCSGQHLHIYIDKNESYAKFQELIAEQTDIRANSQILLYENCPLLLLVTSMQSVNSYPHTNETNPVFLFNMDTSNSEQPRPPALDIPAFPKFSSSVMLDQDASLAKHCASLVHLTYRVVAQFEKSMLYFSQAVNMYLHILSRDIEQVRMYVMQFASTCEETNRRVHQFMKHHDIHMQMLVLLLNGVKEIPKDVLSKKTCLDILAKDQASSMNEVSSGIEGMKRYIEDYNHKIVVRKELTNKWHDNTRQIEEERWVAKMLQLTQVVDKIFFDFRRDKQMKRLNYNDEQIHKFDKVKLTETCGAAMSLAEHNHRFLKTEFEKFHAWFSIASKVRTKLTRLDNQVGLLAESQSSISQQLDKCMEEYSNTLEDIMNQLQGCPIEIDVPPDFLVVEQASSKPPPSKADSSKSREAAHELKHSFQSWISENHAVQEMVDKNNELLKELQRELCID